MAHHQLAAMQRADLSDSFPHCGGRQSHAYSARHLAFGADPARVGRNIMQRTTIILTVILAVLALGSSDLAAKNCRKGKPCGNSCIAASKVCRISAPQTATPVTTSPSNRVGQFSPVAPTQRTRAFSNCAEARAAGAAPVHRGDPGYGPHLDRDNDGVGCEPYRGRR